MRQANISKISILCQRMARSFGTGRLLLLLLCLPAVALLIVACGTTKPSETPKPVSVAPAVANTFVGSAACAACHPKETRDHAATRHAKTLRFADRESLGADAPPFGSVAGTTYEFTNVDDSFGFGLQGGKSFPLQLAFGSGKSGMAFASVVSEESLAEARMSYWPPGKKFYITPSHRNLSESSLGNVQKGKPARDCLGCHVVALPERTLMPEAKFMGVGCESCHGAGSAHIAAMKAGRPNEARMAHLADAGGQQIAELCGRCHRTEKDVKDKNLDRNHTDLFQAFGLAQSRCFKESQDKLTCITCHAPHSNVSTQEASYTKACLRCHSPLATPTPAAIRTPVTLMSAKVCTVNPKEKCTSCHMPKRFEPVFPGSPRHVADHHIRINRKLASVTQAHP